MTWPDDVNAVPKAAALPITNLATDLLSLEKEVKSIADELKTTDPESETFRSVFKSFAISAELDVASCKQILTEMNSSVSKMFLFYGDDAKKGEDAKQIEDFYKMIVAFSQQFENAKKDITKEKEAIIKAEAKAKKAADDLLKNPKKAGAKKPEPAGGGGKGVIDNLMDSIKLGNFKLKKEDTKTDLEVSTEKPDPTKSELPKVEPAQVPAKLESEVKLEPAKT